MGYGNILATMKTSGLFQDGTSSPHTQNTQRCADDKPVSKKGHDESEKNFQQGVLLGGSLRGLIGLLASTFKVKLMVYKRAFLTIGDTAVGKETSVNHAPRRLAHSKLAVYTQSMLLGVVVFGTYDGLVHLWRRRRRQKLQTMEDVNADPDDEGYDNDGDYLIDDSPIDRVWVHGAAGAASGVTRSLFWVGWEKFVYQIPHGWSFSWRMTVHHAVGHGVLFGSYFGLRTFMVHTWPNYFLSKDKEDPSPFLATFVAGGCAGQLHHIAQHYTSHWREMQTTNGLKFPRFQPTRSFLPMALCFFAFEHGADGIEDMIHQLQSVLP